MLQVELSQEPGWPDLDWQALAERSARAALARTPHRAIADARAVEISVRLTDDDEVRTLNRDYRGKDRATNVLSFPMTDDLAAARGEPGDPELLLGDIVLAREVCAAEAAERGVTVAEHATHLLVHGTLHLLGYDHQAEAEAEAMEAIETDTLAGLGIADPYRIREDDSP